MKAFNTRLAGCSLSPHGRTDIRRREAGFQTAGPIDKLENLPFVVDMAEAFGHALCAVQEARVSHSESVDVTKCDSDSRMKP
jgi:hypothetical protein